MGIINTGDQIMYLSNQTVRDFESLNIGNTYYFRSSCTAGLIKGQLTAIHKVNLMLEPYPSPQDWRWEVDSSFIGQSKDITEIASVPSVENDS